MPTETPLFRNDTHRKIVHIDMDAFYASVEQRDRPELRGSPIAVGHADGRGVVATASYEARQFGVRSAMPSSRARQLCPDLIFVEGRMSHYKAVSAEIHEIFRRFTDVIEPISIDEAFLDVTENKRGIDSAAGIAQEIRTRIRDELHLTASAGVSYNKFLAKIASDLNKPDGMTVIPKEGALEFISSLKVEQFWGVGPRTAERMHYIGIFTGADLRKCSLRHLTEVFGKMGRTYYDFARGIDTRQVETEYVRKSVGCEHTLESDISTRSTVIIELYHTVLELARRIENDKFEGRTLTLKIKYSDFSQITRSITTNKLLQTKDDILPAAKRLLGEVEYSANHPIRLIGLSVSNPLPESEMHRAEWVQSYIDFKD